MEGATTPPPAGTSRLRPFNLNDLLSGAFEIYGKSAAQMFMIVALVVIPITIIGVTVARTTLPSDVFLRHGVLETHKSATSGIGGSITRDLLNVLAPWLAAGALFHLQLDTYLGRAHTISDSLAYFGHRALQLIALGIMVLLTVVIGLIAFIVPGIWLGVGVSIAAPVLMLEGKTWFDAMTRSIRLVQGRWWATFGRLIVAYVIVGIWSGIIDAIGGAIGKGLSSVTLFEIVLGVTNAVAFIIILPFSSAVINLMYLDLRVRKEGLSDADLIGRPRDPRHTVPSRGPITRY
jgi:hypothetical protein